MYGVLATGRVCGVLVKRRYISVLAIMGGGGGGIHDVLATGRYVMHTWCVSYREGLWGIRGVLATGEDCGGCMVC